jgi:acyl-[acyl-carrier-protein]-phospholipid O-acyltransferase/long-chain-fatty-acid--[acyl-carrier-protein] ligase
VLAGDLWPQQLSAVVAVPDARKGERLILATQKKDATRSEFMAYAKQRHAADLMIPSEIMIFDKLPVLGSGKADLVSLAKLVNERIAAKPEPARAQA